MSLNRIVYVWLVLALCVALVGVIAAQTEPDDPLSLPADFACDTPDLIAWQADQAEALAGFAQALATDPERALADLYAVGTRYQQAALTCGYIPPDAGRMVINNTDVNRIIAVLDTLSSDPLNGQLLYNGETTTASGDLLGCAGCHANALVAPLTEATWTRWDEQRRLLPAYADQSFAFYIVESIIHPWEYLVDGYPASMPNIYHLQLGYQDMADIVAYLESQDQLED